MPLVTEAGFGFGGSYGRGALRIEGVTVDYYSATKATFGFQIGAQQYAHALFFMTPEALEEFRRSPRLGGERRTSAMRPRNRGRRSARRRPSWTR